MTTTARIGKRGAKVATRFSPWFRVGFEGQPIRVGWYQTHYAGDRKPHPRRRYFDGAQWRAAPRGLVVSFGNMKSYADDKWRGLAADPSKAAK